MNLPLRICYEAQFDLASSRLSFPGYVILRSAFLTQVVARYRNLAKEYDMKPGLASALTAILILGGCTMTPQTASLQGEEWVIEDIASTGVIDNSHAALLFLPDGRLAGSATCNRIIGSYEARGPKLSIKPVGTTMMACPEALMNQERKLLDLLPAIESYRIDDTGALVLSTADGRTIVARQQIR